MEHKTAKRCIKSDKTHAYAAKQRVLEMIGIETGVVGTS